MISQTRYIYVVFLVIGALTAWAVASAAGAVILNFDGVEDMMVGGLVSLSTLIGGFAGIACTFALLRNVKAVSYTNEVVGELVKVTWPSREQTTNNSVVVIIVSIIFSGSLAFFDYTWAWVTSLVFHPEKAWALVTSIVPGL